VEVIGLNLVSFEGLLSTVALDEYSASGTRHTVSKIRHTVSRAWLLLYDDGIGL
jgi:hypothetical protein